MLHLNNFNTFLLENSIIYTALFVDDIVGLKNKFKPIYQNIFYHHSTIDFKPNNIKDLEIGQKHKIKIIGRITTDNVDVLLIENPKSKNTHPHITLSTNIGIKPFQSNDEIKKNLNKIEKFELTIDMTEGYFDGKNDITKITSENKIYVNEPKPSKLKKKLDGVSLGKGKSGYCVYTNRARSKFYPTAEDIPNDIIKFIKSTC